MRVIVRGVTLDSTSIDGTISNNYVTMTATGSGDTRNVTATVLGNYAIGQDIAIELIGQGTGVMTFTVTQQHTDGSVETQIFRNVSVTGSTTGSAWVRPQSTVLLTLNDSMYPEKQEMWAANPNETVTGPTTDFGGLLDISANPNQTSP